MIESVIKALISILLLAACVFLVVWVVGMLGIPMPSQVITIIWVIVALIALLILFRLLRPHAGSWLP